jgi:hypothetical protein
MLPAPCSLLNSRPPKTADKNGQKRTKVAKSGHSVSPPFNTLEVAVAFRAILFCGQFSVKNIPIIGQKRTDFGPVLSPIAHVSELPSAIDFVTMFLQN